MRNVLWSCAYVCVYAQWLMITVIALGIICSITFHIGLREVHADVELNPTLVTRRKSMEWYDWLKEHQFYLVISVVTYFLTELLSCGQRVCEGCRMP